jgi:ribosomal protein L37AE/L43A
LQQRALASEKVAWVDDDDDDEGPDGAYGTMYGKPLGGTSSGYSKWEEDQEIKERLEYYRTQLRDECISQQELAELAELSDHIEPGDVELLEAAGVPEFPEEAEPVASKPKKRFRTTNKDKEFMKAIGIKAHKIAMQVEEGVNQVCPNCHGQSVKNVEDSSPEEGIVECNDCGCFFSL